VGAGTEENWTALFNTIALFRRVALEVGNHLGYTYLDDLDRQVVVYLERVKNREIP
jgi:aminoglycoside 6-adenylyltransferase